MSALFDDFTKAFHFVNRSKVWTVLEHNGLSPKTVGFIKSVFDCVKLSQKNVKC